VPQLMHVVARFLPCRTGCNPR